MTPTVRRRRRAIAILVAVSATVWRCDIMLTNIFARRSLNLNETARFWKLCIVMRTYFTSTWLRYVRVFAVAIPSVCLSVCRLSSVVCNVGAPYSGGWTFRQNFFTAMYLGILWPPYKILRRSSQGNPSIGCIKRKSKIQRFWACRRLYLVNGTK